MHATGNWGTTVMAPERHASRGAWGVGTAYPGLSGVPLNSFVEAVTPKGTASDDGALGGCVVKPGPRRGLEGSRTGIPRTEGTRPPAPRCGGGRCHGRKRPRSPSPGWPSATARSEGLGAREGPTGQPGGGVCGWTGPRAPVLWGEEWVPLAGGTGAPGGASPGRRLRPGGRRCTVEPQ